jgi:glycosyl transferase family 25
MNVQEIPSYVINLDQNKNKWFKTKQTLNNFGINPQRFSAVYGKNLDNNFINNITDPSVYYSITYGRSTDEQMSGLGAIGCYLSHIKLWQNLVNSETQNTFLIFEDDVEVNFSNKNNYTQNINYFVQNVITTQPDWDFIFLGYSKPLLIFSNDVCNKNICQIKDKTFCTHAYIINKKGAKKLLDKAFPIVHQIDSFISFMSAREDIKSFRPIKPFFIQSEEITNIIFNSSMIQEGPIKSIKTIITRFNNKVILYSLFMIFIIFIYFIIYANAT